MIGKRLAHYEITGLLGQGGMGAVYRARDTRLERDVAIKILVPAMAAERRRLERFEREAKVVAGLNHPNIVTLYSVEEAEGLRFLVMELVEGRPLDHEIDLEGMPLERVVDIGIALADALAAAHEKGVVHRDLKPANVMITPENRVKVLDFGLAKLTEPDSDASQENLSQTRAMGITQHGATVGTVPYMSPEQLRHARTDGRSDLFSLGVLLYEMATGDRPFYGFTSADLTSAILRDKPTQLVQVKPDFPPHLGHIISRCLEKDPDKRFQTAREVGRELRDLKNRLSSGFGPLFLRPRLLSARWGVPAAAVLLVVILGAVYLAGWRPGGGAGRPPEPVATPAAETPRGPTANSIAVLPFVNLTAEPDQDYFSDGIAEELLNLLARVPELQVAARTSSFSFKGKDLAVPEIARQLHVAHVLEGGVRIAGDRIRITTQLVQATDGFNVWSASFDLELGDVFAIQEQIAADVVNQLKVELLDAVPTLPATDPAAYTLFLRGRHQARLGTAEGFAQAGVLLRQALDIDPSYAPAWSELARIYGNQAGVGLLASAEGYRLSREAAEQALALDPLLASAHGRLAWIAMFHDRDLEGAAGHLQRGLAIDPANNDLLRNAATLLKYLGRLDEAIAVGSFAVARDPLNPTGHANLGYAAYYAGRDEEAMASFRKTLELSPGRIAVNYYIGALELAAGDARAALETTRKERFDLFRLVGLVMIHHALGDAEASDAALAELIAEHAQDAAYNIAYALAYRGEADRAFDWLGKAVEYGDAGLGDVMVEPRFGNLHDDPRWLPFLESIGKAPGQLAAVEFEVSLPG